MSGLGSFINALLGWLHRSRRPAEPSNDDALADDVLDAWLDEDEIDASGL
jgi:hypothetical protein